MKTMLLMSMAKVKKKEAPEITDSDIADKILAEKEKIESEKNIDKEKLQVSEAVDFDLANLEGVGKVRMERLNKDGIFTPMDLVISGPVKVADITGMDVDACEKLVTKARNYLQESGIIRKSFMTAKQVLDYREKVLKHNRIHTGCFALNDLLGGGFELQAMTEFYGVYGSGKTQICHTACVMAQLPKDQGGLDGEVIFIDTENTFRPERIRDILLARKIIPAQKQKKKSDPLVPENPLDLEKFLNRITVARAYNSSHQQLILTEIQSMLKAEQTALDSGEKKEGDPRPVLIIVDSITSHFRSEYLGRGTLNARQQALSDFIHKLVRIAETFNVAVVGTNQVLSSPDGFGDPTRPVGGHILGHTSTYRIYLKKSGQHKTIAKMDDSPEHPSSEIVFERTTAGITDIETT